MKNPYLLILVLLIFLSACFARSKPEAMAQATYIANEGVLITKGETKIIFDPLFQQGFGHYRLPPSEYRQAILEGSGKFAGLDAVFISHSHPDHFSTEEIIKLLKSQSQLHLVAPQQAIKILNMVDSEFVRSHQEYIHSIDLAYQDAPISLSLTDIYIEAVRIPHSGWPRPDRAAVQNIAYRVTLNNKNSFIHMGDADPNDIHFSPYTDFWQQRETDLALPPYWFLQSSAGRDIINSRLNTKTATGIHVPAAILPKEEHRPAAFQNIDIFITPGEVRDIPLAD
ncbi:MAG: MBL fold metallo-hydrolase [bacterium]